MNVIPAARSDILGLKSYRPGAQIEDSIRLNANEAPYAQGDTPLNRYPEVRPFGLKQALSDALATNPGNLLVTRGSSESIDVLIRSWCRAYQDEIVITPPTFEMYRVYADVQGVKVVEAPLNQPEFDLDPEAVLSACGRNTKLIFICSPNNPTGTLFPVSAITAIARARFGKSLVIVDEAYVEFSGRESLAAAVAEYPNMVVLRTMSKAHALAGARCGATIADARIIDVLGKVLPPYSFPTPVIQCVAEAFTPETTARSAASIQALVAERNRVQQRLNSMSCVARTWPSSANFILIRFRDLRSVLEHLMKDRILIRDFGDTPGLENCARVTVGTPKENDALLDALARLEDRPDE